MKRFGTFLLASMMLLCFMAIPVSANSPGHRQDLVVQLTNSPENAYYVDLLVPLTRDDKQYIDTNFFKLPGKISESAEIVTYDKDGYMSYTFHFKEASSNMRIIDNTVTFFYGNVEQMEAVKELGDLKLAILDEFGKIIKVSNSFALKERTMFSINLGSVNYNVETNGVQVDSYANVAMIVTYGIIAVLGIIMTVLFEWLIAGWFRFDKVDCTIVLWVNIISQILMRVLTLILYGSVFKTYFTCVLIMELLVYAGEFLVYNKLLHDTPWKKRIAFVLVANTVTLMAGLYLNQLFF